MKKLRRALHIIEGFQRGRLVDVVFSDNVTIRYTDLEMVDKSIYKSKDFLVAKIIDNKGMESKGFAEFNINEIDKIVDVKNHLVLYEKNE